MRAQFGSDKFTSDSDYEKKFKLLRKETQNLLVCVEAKASINVTGNVRLLQNNV